MMIISVASAMLCCLTVASAQFENGINFNEGSTNAISPTQSGLTTYIVNTGQNCRCIPIGTSCSNSNNIDIRIVNLGQNQPTCQSGYTVCCSASTSPTNQPTTRPPTMDYCGLRKLEMKPQPVVGQASFGAYPWQAAILTKSGESYIGSGVLMDSTHVVTTAHKVAAYVNNPDGLLIRLGDWDGRSNAEPYPPATLNVARITIHPNFNSQNLENDIAVVRLNGVAPLTYPNVNTACKPNGPPAAGQRCYVSGWGKNAFTGQYQSVMREVDVPIVDGNSCENRLRQTRLGANFVLNKNSFICAGGESGKDACTGDGGSPLVCPTSTGQWQVVGLVAWGIGCANTGVPGVYTNVWNFLPWINQMLATA